MKDAKIFLLFFIITESLISDEKNWLDIQKRVFSIQKKSYSQHDEYKSQYAFVDARNALIDYYSKLIDIDGNEHKQVEEIVNEIVKERPKYMTKETYIKFLDNYVQFFVNSKMNYIYGQHLFFAKLLLFKIREIAPNRVETYRDLGDVYIKLYLYYSQVFIEIPAKSVGLRGATKDDGGHNVEDTVTYKAKKNYQIYVQKCKEQKIEPKLTKEIEFILKRDRVFFEIYSTFDGVDENSRYPVSFKKPSSRGMYKEEYKDICKEYVASLNRMPDRDYIRCMRYNFEDNSSFRYYFKRDSNMSKELIELYIEQLETKQYLGNNRVYNFKKDMFYHDINYVFKYKDEFFIADGSVFRLFQGKELSMYIKLYSEHMNNLCYFGFVDFKREYLQVEREDTCRYKQKIFLEEEGERLWK